MAEGSAGGASPPVWARGMVAALARGDHRYVLRTADLALEAAAADPALLARVHTWLAQAWSRDGDTEQAREHLRLAIRAVKEAGDEAGLAQIRGLRRQVLEQARSREEASPPPPPGPPAAPAPSWSGEDRAAQAIAALARGDEHAAVEHAIAAREQARRAADPKGEVVALLALARVPGHADAALRAARDVADHAGDNNLVAAVVRGARELGVDLGVRVF
ncbi:hypothetical protein L6R53_17740 [Myxococcota bacterium]|nr:hypothetical protein [Myxococcota bacterium]